MKHLVMTVSVLVLVWGACKSSSAPTSDASGVTALQITDVAIGTGVEAVNGRSVTVHYTGWLYSTTTADHRGTQFDSSRVRNQPFTFTLGVGQVIRGWDQGVVGMRVGGRRTLVIPSNLGYGASGTQGIPPNSTLIFDVEVLDVR